MKFERFSLPIRIAIAIIIAYAMLRFIFSGTGGKLGAADQIVGVLFAAVYGLILFALFGFSVLRRFAERFGSLYEPGDKHFRIMPEYSTAQARVKAGRYEEAITEYRKVIEHFPQDIHAHVAIADIAIEHLKDLGLAESELQSAVAKATSPQAISLATHRLADFYQKFHQDLPRAIEVMRQLAVKLPGSNEASRAEARVVAMQKLAGGALAPEVRKKIAFKPTDEETLRKRRGY